MHIYTFFFNVKHLSVFPLTEEYGVFPASLDKKHNAGTVFPC